MILWTVQDWTVWDKLQHYGVLRGAANFVNPSFLAAYTWLSDEMRHRLSPPPTEDSLPVWAWYQWGDQKKRKPDLRFQGHLRPGAKGVRIEFRIDDEKVLLSDFELWHYVLNYWYLPNSLEEGEQFDALVEARNLSYYTMKPLPDDELHRQIQKSWRKIFDIDWEAEEVASPRAQKSIQATFWELRLEQVIRIQEFTAR